MRIIFCLLLLSVSISAEELDITEYKRLMRQALQENRSFNIRKEEINKTLSKKVSHTRDEERKIATAEEDKVIDEALRKAVTGKYDKEREIARQKEEFENSVEGENIKRWKFDPIETPLD